MSTNSDSNSDSLLFSLPYAYGEPLAGGVLRQRPEDFFVEEVLGFEPSGEGEHVFLFVEKMGLNTDQVAQQLATRAGVSPQQVSYSGMKDRWAVTQQWFSVHLPGNKSVDWCGVESEQLKVLKVQRHNKKLRRGVHRANRFLLRITKLSGDSSSVMERLAQVKTVGVPNYFGEQRFGRGGNNLREAERWFAGYFKPRRHQRGIYLSAARAFLFNAVLARRIEEGSWCRAKVGELLMLAGSHSLFPYIETQQQDIQARIDGGDLDATGPLFGVAGKLTPEGEVESLESEVLAAYPQLLQGLIKEKVAAERRALRVIPGDLDSQLSADAIELSFTLARGCFATAVVRELLHYQALPTAMAKE